MAIRPAGWGDLEAAAELLGAQNRAAVGVAGLWADHLRSEWKRPGFVLGEDNVVAEVGGRVVGYAAVSLRGELVLAAPDELADELLERIAVRARLRGDTALAVTVLSAEGTLARLVERHPFELRHETLVMGHPLGASIERVPPVPGGITIRTFRQRDAHVVHQLLNDAYGAWDPLYVPIPHPDWTSYMTRDPEFDPDVWWLAERDETLVGCALHWSSGWLKDLAVRDTERGRGVGSALVAIGLAEFARRGKSRVGLKVDAGNPTGAIGLYDRVGFVTERREAVWDWRL